MRVPYASKNISDREIKNILEVIDDNNYTHGRFCQEFERNLSKCLNIKHCLMVNSGSSANLLAFMALTQEDLGERRIKRGDEVITVACGFPTTIAPIVQYGAIPVFVDVTLPEYNIDVTQLALALSNKTKAVMIAHTMGNPFNIRAVKDFCDKNNLWLIEDNCDALGAKYELNNKMSFTGTFGDIGTSSFYPAHHITTAEGGAVYTNNDTLFKIMQSLRDWGRDCTCPSGFDNCCGNRFNNSLNYDHKYIYARFGYNLKATEFQGAMGVAQLEKLESIIRERKKNWKYFREALSFKSNYLLLPENNWVSSDPSWFGFVVTLQPRVRETRHSIVKYLDENGIQTRPLFAGNIIKHPCMKGVEYRQVGHLKNTDYIMDNTFWWGVHPLLTDEQKKYIVDKLNYFLY